jgi:hypothetical protein
MKSILLLIILLQLSSNCFAKKQKIEIPITCHAIPLKSNSLCLVKTSSSEMPVNDVVFYRRDSSGYLFFIEAIKGDVAHVLLWGFSIGGKYTVITYAEEGGPNFLIYETDKFLSSKRPLEATAVISEYDIRSIVSVDDSGDAVVELLNSDSYIRNNQPCIAVENLPDYTDQNSCHIRYSIFNSLPNAAKGVD